MTFIVDQPLYLLHPHLHASNLLFISFWETRVFYFVCYLHPDIQFLELAFSLIFPSLKQSSYLFLDWINTMDQCRLALDSSITLSSPSVSIRHPIVFKAFLYLLEVPSFFFHFILFSLISIGFPSILTLPNYIQVELLWL